MKDRTNTPDPATAEGLPIPAEYRHGRLDLVQFAANAGRPAETMVAYAHTVEVGDRTYEFREVAPKGAPVPQNWEAPFPKGTPVTVYLDPQAANVVVNGRDGKPRPATGLFRLRVTAILPRQ